MRVRPIDIVISALTCWGEARGEPADGKIAVLQVIKNRAEKNNTYPAVECLKPYQFSCWNKNDPNYPKLQAFLKDMSKFDPFYLNLAKRVLNGDLAFPALANCYWYMTKSLYDSPKRPKWADKLKVLATIGNHVFLGEEDA